MPAPCEDNGGFAPSTFSQCQIGDIVVSMQRVSAFLIVFLLLFTVPGFARGSHGGSRGRSSSSRSSASRPNYGGGKHTTSHGGVFRGSSGSSHKGGKYQSPTGSR